MGSQQLAPTRIRGLLAASALLNCMLVVFAVLSFRHPDVLYALKSRWSRHSAPANGFTTSHLVREPLFRSLPKSENGKVPLLLLGDSQIEYCPWEEWLQTPALNRGIAGETVADVLARTDSVILQNPEEIILLVGTNDALLGTDLTAFSSTYAALVTRLRSALPKTVIYLETIPPVRPTDEVTRVLGRSRVDGLNPLIRKMNDQLRGLADGKNVRIIDSYNDLLFNGELKEDLTVDGFHLNPAGYGVLREHIVPILQHPVPQKRIK